MNVLHRTPRANAVQSRAGRVTLCILVFLIVGIGALAMYWVNYAQLDTLPPAAEVQTASHPRLASPQPPPDASEQAIKTISALQDTIKDLQSSQKQLQNRVERVEIQLTKEQGEAKLLSDQV